MKPKLKELRVTVNWRPIKGKPSPLWHRLVDKLLQAKTENSPVGNDCKTAKGNQVQKEEL